MWGNYCAGASVNISPIKPGSSQALHITLTHHFLLGKMFFISFGQGNEELAKPVSCCGCSWLSVQWAVHLLTKNRSAESWWIFCHCPAEISLCQAWCIHSVLQPCEGLNNLCSPLRIQKLKCIWGWELKRMTFHGNVLLLSPLAWWKVSPRSAETEFSLLFSSFFCKRKSKECNEG